MSNITESRTYASPQELQDMAQQIWKKIKNSPISAQTQDEEEKILREYQSEFADFNQSFPIVLRWMVQVRKFSSRAFGKYLTKHANTDLNSREEFLKLQAEYLVLLYREEHPHADELFVKNYRSSLIQQLLDEDKLFIEISKEVEKDMELKNKEFDEDRRRRLIEIIKHKVQNE